MGNRIKFKRKVPKYSKEDIYNLKHREMVKGERHKKKIMEDEKYVAISHLVVKELERRQLNLSYANMLDITKEILQQSTVLSKRFSQDEIGKIAEASVRRYNKKQNTSKKEEKDVEEEGR